MSGLPYLKLKIKSNFTDAKAARHDEGVHRDIERRSRVAASAHSDAAIREKAVVTYHKAALIAEMLMAHRRHIKSEQRSTLLVYGFFRGVPYRTMESRTKSYPDWGVDGDPKASNRMRELVEAFSEPSERTDVLQRFAQWRDEANSALRIEFQRRAKEAPVPRIRTRRVVDQIVRLECQAKRTSMRALLNAVGMDSLEWSDIVAGRVEFTESHARRLSDALSIPADAFMSMEQNYKAIPPNRTASQKNKARKQRRKAAVAAQ